MFVLYDEESTDHDETGDRHFYRIIAFDLINGETDLTEIIHDLDNPGQEVYRATVTIPAGARAIVSRMLSAS